MYLQKNKIHVRSLESNSLFYILEFLSHRLQGGEITFLGNGEIQMDKNSPINLVFETDNFSKVLSNIVDTYYEYEKDDYINRGNPSNHIFKDLEIIKNILDNNNKLNN